MRKSHNSSYEKLFEKLKICIDKFEFVDRISIERFSEKEIDGMLKFALGRHDHFLGEYKMGGRTSNIKYIISILNSYPVFSAMWYLRCNDIDEQYPKSTIMKALKIIVENKKD
jgi:hypothetical protein